MRTFIAGQEAADEMEFVELALGIDVDLFRGPLERETVEERHARWDVAREVLRDLRESADAGDEVAGWDALYADALTRTVPFIRSSRDQRTGTGAAA
ncbi:hypothetical protein [Streptomyces piniterrae]|nr:hypothetical protein [Streptomyces piniterrae]